VPKLITSGFLSLDPLLHSPGVRVCGGGVVELYLVFEVRTPRIIEFKDVTSSLYLYRRLLISLG
jgi:hypothetical protein